MLDCFDYRLPDDIRQDLPQTRRRLGILVVIVSAIGN
jgi:hypothetical protein